jgi:hypothetical protein
MEQDMHGIEPRTLSNRELILACDNEWSMGGLPSELQLELYNRFCKLAPLDEFPAIDPRQIPLPL